MRFPLPSAARRRALSYIFKLQKRCKTHTCVNRINAKYILSKDLMLQNIFILSQSLPSGCGMVIAASGHISPASPNLCFSGRDTLSTGHLIWSVLEWQMWRVPRRPSVFKANYFPLNCLLDSSTALKGQDEMALTSQRLKSLETLHVD